MNSQLRNHTINVDWKRSGQPRPYADSFYEAVFWIEGHKIDERTAKCLARELVHSFEEPQKDWASGQLHYCRSEGETDKWGRSEKWHVLITTAFTD